MVMEAWIVIVLLAVAVFLFSTEKIPVDLAAMMILIALILSRVLTPSEGFYGFSNEATITVGAMFVLSAGFYKTGALNLLAIALTRIGKRNFWLLLVILMLSIGATSAFIINTAIVAIFLPIVVTVAKEIKVSPSKLLIPLSFASIFGGVCTLIGTSTNILVNSIAQQHGQPAFRLFEFSELGLVMFGAGMLYMLFAGVRLIPNRRIAERLTEDFGMEDYLAEIVVLPNAKSAGRPLAESPLVKEMDLDILNVIRDGKQIWLSPDSVLLVNDLLRVRASVKQIRNLQEREGFVLKPERHLGDTDLKSAVVTLVEAVVAPRSWLVGKSLKEVNFRKRFDATAIAIRHHGAVIHEKLAHIELRAGDVLLIEAKVDRIDKLKRNAAFIFISEVGIEEFRKNKILPASLILIGVVALTAFGFLPIVVSAIAGCILMVLSGCITPQEAYDSVDWRILLLLAGTLALGTALEKTGTAVLLSKFLVSSIGQLGPILLLSSFYLITSLLTEMMSNNATAVVMCPIAIAAAESMGVSPRPFLMAVAFAASASFMTPVGYQTNTLVYGPGQYRFSDFLRVGTPLNILFWILATLLIPYFWPL